MSDEMSIKNTNTNEHTLIYQTKPTQFYKFEQINRF